MIDVDVQTPDLGGLSRALREAGRSDLNRNMRARIRHAVKPVMNEQQSEVRSLPSSSGGGTRDEIANALQLQIRSRGVRVRVNTARISGHRQRLPRLFNKGNWRHMVYGDQDNWVSQHMPPGWFDRPAKNSHARVHAEAVRAMEDTAREIENSA